MTSGRASAAGEAGLFTRDFASLSLAVLVFFVAGGILLPVTPRYTEGVLLGDRIAVGIVIGAFAVSSLRLGLGSSSPFLGAFAIVVVALRFLGARLPDRLGAARLAGSAFVATTIGLLISGLAVARLVPASEGLMVGTLVFGAGVAFTMPALMSMAVIGVPSDERGAVVGTSGLFIDAAFGLSPAVLGLVATWTDYPPTFLISAAIAAVGAAYLLVRRPGAGLRPDARPSAASPTG